MHKPIVAIAALVVSSIAYYVARNADNKASSVEAKVDTAIKDLSNMTSDVIDHRVSDGLIQEAIRRAAEKKVGQITKSISGDIRSEVETKVGRLVQSAFDKARSDLNISDMVRRKAKEIVRGFDADDLSKNLAEEIKDEVISQMKEQVKKNFTNSIF